MQTIGEALGFVAGGLSDKNYAQSLDFYRFWLGTGRTHIQVPSNQIFDAIWNNRAAGSSIDSNSCQLIHSTAHLILRFASDAQSDPILSPYSARLESRLCAGSLREFSNNNLMIARYGRDAVGGFYADVNLLAHWTNLGYVEEATIRGHILQSLISHPKLYDHQADALIILFKQAGATFEAYADPSVVDRCFELLGGHSYTPPYDASREWKRELNDNYLRDRGKLVQVRAWHPNEVLNLFVQQGLTSALPMAYYMATRRGPNSLMDGSLPRNATLSPAVLRSAIRGLMTLRQAELDETHRLIFEQKGSHPCAALDCLSRSPAGTAALEAYRKVFEHIVDPSQLGAKVLEVPEFYEDRGGDLRCVGPGICSSCVERWESGHAELRKRIWATLPEVFGLA